MTRRSRIFLVAAVVGLGLSTCFPVAFASGIAATNGSGQANKPHRMIVLTDIGAEVDDTESMVRLLLYSDVIDIQGSLRPPPPGREHPSRRS